ncbi:hypothetical protein H9P43_006587, partial [Blastocladiella emersonii ATCC 22665]
PAKSAPGKRRRTASLSGASEDANAMDVDAAPPTDCVALHLLGGDSPGAVARSPAAHANLKAVLHVTHRLLAHVPAVHCTRSSTRPSPSCARAGLSRTSSPSTSRSQTPSMR